MPSDKPQNLSYLLHLWPVERNGQPRWWASLENPRTGERQTFADLAELYVFLDEKTDCRWETSAKHDVQPHGEMETSMTRPVKETYSGRLSYLLHLLWVQRKSKRNWRISLQSFQTSERLNFNDLAGLTDYLQEKLVASNDRVPDETNSL